MCRFALKRALLKSSRHLAWHTGDGISPTKHNDLNLLVLAPTAATRDDSSFAFPFVFPAVTPLTIDTD